MKKLKISDNSPYKVLWQGWFNQLGFWITYKGQVGPTRINEDAARCINRIIDAAYEQGVKDAKGVLISAIYDIKSDDPWDSIQDAKDLIPGKTKLTEL